MSGGNKNIKSAYDASSVLYTVTIIAIQMCFYTNSYLHWQLCFRTNYEHLSQEREARNYYSTQTHTCKKILGALQSVCTVKALDLFLCIEKIMNIYIRSLLWMKSLVKQPSETFHPLNSDYLSDKHCSF